MKISNSKDGLIKITLLATVGVIFSCCWCCFLGCLNSGIENEIRTIMIVSIVAGGLILGLWILCFLLIKFEKKYYLIDQDGVKLYEKDKIVFELKNDEISSVRYVRFIWIFTFQMGSGYLHLTYMDAGNKDKKFASILLPTGIAYHSISMSLKQAKQVAKILNKNLEIK